MKRWCSGKWHLSLISYPEVSAAAWIWVHLSIYQTFEGKNGEKILSEVLLVFEYVLVCNSRFEILYYKMVHGKLPSKKLHPKILSPTLNPTIIQTLTQGWIWGNLPGGIYGGQFSSRTINLFNQSVQLFN